MEEVGFPEGKTDRQTEGHIMWWGHFNNFIQALQIQIPIPIKTLEFK